MAPTPTRPTLALRDRVAALRAVLAAHPDAAVGVLDRSRALVDPHPLCAAEGIALAGHPVLQGQAVVEFVAPADARLLNLLSAEAERVGAARGTFRLRTGADAEVHFINLAASHGGTVVLVVPPCDSTVPESPLPTAVEAGPRIGVLLANGHGIVTSAEDPALAMLGRSRDELVGQPAISVIHPDDQEAGIVNWVAAMQRRGVALRWRTRMLRPSGSSIWVETTLTNNIGPAGDGEVRVELVDVSAEVDAVAALAAERHLLAVLTEALPVGVAKLAASGRVEYGNERLSDLFDRDRLDTAEALARAGDPSGAGGLAAGLEALLDGREGSMTIEVVRAGDEPRYHHWTLRPLLGFDGLTAGGVVCVSDVTASVQMQVQLEQQATTDALTGCLNRAAIHEVAERRAHHPSAGTALVFVDLDGFKTVNDTQGHAAGDLLLQTVAERLRRAVRPTDVVGRLGGDEFVVLAGDVVSSDNALELARRIATGLRFGPWTGPGAPEIAASVGVAWAKRARLADLLPAADRAMYQAKTAGSEEPVLALV